jgi:probable rRNA maturation factor
MGRPAMPRVDVRLTGGAAGRARRLRLLARHALRALGRADREVHVTVVGARAMRALHRRWRGSGAATDVLAFDLEGPGPDGPGRLLGEVVVSADAARRQARRLRVPQALELDLLVVHGILHLAGWDDGDPVEARLMHERAREILEGAHGRRAVPDRLWQGLLPGRGEA